MKIYSIKLAILLILALAMTSCKHDHAHDTDGKHIDQPAAGEDDHGHDHPIEDPLEDPAEHGHQKTVHLNPAQYRYAEVDTGWFEMKNLSDVIHANGHTKLDPQDQADVSMPISGTIQSIKIIEGDYVRKGKVLASMSSMDLGKLNLQTAQLEQARSVAQINIDYLELEFKRQEKLMSANVNAKKVYEKVRADLNTEKGNITAYGRQIEIINSMIGQVSQSSTSSSIYIISPISGYVTDVMIKIGSRLEAGDVLFSIVDNSKMHVDLLVYEKDLGAIKVGQKVRFMLTNQSNAEITGTIYNIGKSFQSDTKSVAVHADVDKTEANLIPGMYVNALIDIGADVVQSLPVDAVVMAEGRQFIFLWEGENARINETEPHDHKVGDDHDHEDATEDEITFARLEVKTGASQLGYIQVTPLGEIHTGDKIVTRGAYYLQSHLQKSEGAGGHSH